MKLNFDRPGSESAKAEGGAEKPKDLFLRALEVELSAMEKAGRISPERAKDKRNAAALIEAGLSDDPKHDALIFSRAGIASEGEMIQIIEGRGAERELAAGEAVDPSSPVADVVAVTESAKIAYGERLQQDIPETERLELIQAILSTGRVAKYFKRIEPRIQAGRTIEEVLAEDRATLEARKKEGAVGSTEESTLRLAEVVVQNAKEKRDS